MPTDEASRRAAFEAAFRDVPDAILIADTTRRILLVNPAMNAVFGYDSDELLDQSTRLLYASDAEFHDQGASRYNVAAMDGGSRYVTRFCRKNGEVFPAEATGAPVRNEAGEVIGFIAIIRDITSRERMAARLEDSHRRLEFAIEALHEGILLFGADERLITSNSRFHEIYSGSSKFIRVGRTYEEMLRDAVRVGQFDIPRDQQEEWIRNRVAGFRNPTAEPMETVLADDRWTLVTKRRTAAGDTVTSYVDITRRKRLEDALTLLNAISSTRALDHDDKIRAALDLGVGHFGLPAGIISRISGDTYEVRHAISSDDSITPGARFSLARTFCVHTLEASKPIGLHDVARSPLVNHPCYQDFPLGAYLGAPLMVDGERFGTLNFSGRAPRERPFDKGELKFIALLADWIGNELARQEDARLRHELEAELRRLAMHDGLTGIFNRRALVEAGERAFAQARRYRRPLSVIMADLDRFKAINDRYGHDGGDAALRGFVETVQPLLREVDTLGRVGGEEFAIIMPETSVAGALEVAERIGAVLRTHSIAFRKAQIGVTSSCGVAEMKLEDQHFASMITRADAALFKAKSAGRDRSIAA